MRLQPQRFPHRTERQRPVLYLHRAECEAVPRAEVIGLERDDLPAKLAGFLDAILEITHGRELVDGLGPVGMAGHQPGKHPGGGLQVAPVHRFRGLVDLAPGSFARFVEPAFPQPGHRELAPRGRSPTPRAAHQNVFRARRDEVLQRREAFLAEAVFQRGAPPLQFGSGRMRRSVRRGSRGWKNVVTHCQC